MCGSRAWIIKNILIILLVLSPVAPTAAFDFLFKGSIDETFDDNILSSGISQKSDWITNFTLGLGIKSENHRFQFDFFGNIYQQIYAIHKDESKNYQDLLISVNSDFSENISLKLNDIFQHYPEPMSYTTLFGKDGTNIAYISNNFSSAFSAFVTKHLFFDITYRNTFINYDNKFLADSVLHNPGVDIGYSFNSYNILRIGYMNFIMIYENGNKQNKDRGYVEYEKFFTNQLRTILQGGCDYNHSSDDQKLYPRWKVSIIDDIDQKNVLKIEYLKETTISDTTDDTFNNWNIAVTLKRDMNLRTAIDISLFYGSGFYEISKTRNKLAGSSITLTFIVTDFINFRFGYSYFWTSTASLVVEKTNYNRNRVFIGLTALY